MKEIKKLVFSLLMMIMLVTLPLGTTIPQLGVIHAEAASISKKSVKVNVGKSTTLKIKGAKGKVKWKSNNTKVATVSGKGKVNGKKAGTATITATVKGKTYSCKVTVVQKVTKVTLNKKKITLALGRTYQLKTTLSPKGIVSGLKWKSSKTKYATVDKNGLVTAKKQGSATITVTATDGSKKNATCKVTVKDIRVKKLSVSGKNTLIVGETAKLTAKTSPTNANGLFSWKSSNNSIVTVSKTGEVVAKKAGSAIVTVTASDNSKKSATIEITVNDKPKPSVLVTDPNTEVKISKTSLNLNYGESGLLELLYLVGDGDVSWNTSDSSVVGITKSGVDCIVEAKRAGTATITATSGISKYTCKVTVSAKSISLSTKKYELVEGGQQKIDLNGNESIAEGWTSSNTSVATVDYRGYVSAKAKGSCEISVYVGGALYKFPVTVIEETLETEDPETEKETEESKETGKELEKEDKFNYFWDYGSLPGGARVKYQIVTEKPIDYFYIGVTGNSAIITDIIKDGNDIDIFVVGRTKGESIITVKEGNVVKATSKITVTSDDTKYLAYSSWKETVKLNIWKDGMSTFDKVLAVGNFICKNYDYGNEWDYMCFAEGYGGSCFAASELICNFADDLGLECKVEHIYGGADHVCALVKIGGTWYYFDAGTNDTAGNRGCMTGTLN